MDKQDEIKIYRLISISDLHKHYPAIRHTLFGMGKDEVRDFVCNINELGYITFQNKAKLNSIFGSVDKLTEAELRITGKEFIDRFNKKIAESNYFQKEKFPQFIQLDFLKPAIITKALNLFTRSFDHYVLTYSFIARPLSSQGNVPIFDAIVELRISGSKNLIGFFYKWRPVINSLQSVTKYIYRKINPIHNLKCHWKNRNLGINLTKKKIFYCLTTWELITLNLSLFPPPNIRIIVHPYFQKVPFLSAATSGLNLTILK